VSSKSAEELAEQAKGSIEKKDLVKTKRFFNNTLYDSPLITYIRDNEQPHYIFANSGEYSGMKVFYPAGDEFKHEVDGYVYFMVTNQRVIYVAGKKEGDVYASFPLSSIEIIGSTGTLNKKLKMKTVDEMIYVFSVGNNFSEISDAADYVRQTASDVETQQETIENEIFTRQNSDNESTESGAYSERIQDITSNAISRTVNKKRLKERDSVIINKINNNEQPHFIFSGATSRGFEIREGSSTEEYSSGMLRPDLLVAAFRTVITDNRVILLIIRREGISHKWDLNYSTISGVGTNIAESYYKLEFDTTGRTYIADVSESITDVYKGRQPSEEIEKAREYVRKKINSEADDTTISEDTTSNDSEIPPIEKLERLQELNDKGAISDEEFEKKKTKLLDEI